MATASRIASTGGLRDVSIKLVGAGTTWTDVPGAMELTPATEADTVIQVGDDTYIRTFMANYRGSLTLISSMTFFDLMALVSGNSASTTGGIEYDLYAGTDLELEPPTLVIRAKCRAQDDDSTSTTYGAWLWFHIYALKCQISKPTSAPEVGNNKLMQQRLEFTVIPSSVDETNTDLPVAIDKALYHMRIKTTAIW